ncbi:ABC transporter permease [Cytobacillus sp. FJAT-54145]|uniref:ABC transporter permease n=1 Tax=Cytobacillus spartinae TaxID=3299023 RepID=A0ABW6KCF8_9BACI
MFQVLSSDLLKVKRKLIWFLIFLGPFGVIALEAVNFTVRYEYLTTRYADDLWGGLIESVRFLTIPVLFIGLTIISSMIANIEHQTNAWKQVLSLPISRTKVFTGKFALTTIMLLVSTTLLGIGTVILGLALKFGSDVPFMYLLKMTYYPYFAALPFVALQVWLSITVKNQATPLTIGILGMILSMYSMGMPDFVPYKWASLENQWGEPIYSVVAGLTVGMVIYAIGVIDFARKDVS